MSSMITTYTYVHSQLDGTTILSLLKFIARDCLASNNGFSSHKYVGINALGRLHTDLLTTLYILYFAWAYQRDNVCFIHRVQGCCMGKKAQL